MTKYIIFLFLSCLLNSSKLVSQKVSKMEGNLHFARSQYKAANYKTALKEYLRVHFYDRSGHNERTTQEIAYCFQALGDTDNALKYLQKYLRISDLSTDEKANGAYCKVELLLRDEPTLALVELFQFDNEVVAWDENKYNYYVAISQLLADNFDAGFLRLDKLSYAARLPSENLTELKKQLEKNHTKKHFIARLLSSLLPGLGQAVNGDAKDGLNSLLINGVLAVIFFNVQMNLTTLDATLSVLPWLGRYYVGGMGNAHTASKKKQARVKGELLTELNGLLQAAKQEQ